jgi:hypothetical protein
MVEVGEALRENGERDRARPLLERAVRDLGRFLGRDHDPRLRAIASLRDLLIAEYDYQRAALFQRELMECQTRRLGTDHPETIAARASLSVLLLAATEHTHTEV